MSQIPPTGPGPDDLPGSSGRRKRITVVVGATVAALALGGAALVLRGGDGAGTDPVPSVVRRQVSAVVPSPAATPSPLGTVSTAALSGSGRNPYKALYVPPVAAASPGAGSGDATGGQPAAPAPPVPTPTTTTTTTTPPATPAPVAAYRVKLVSVGDLQGDVRPMLWNVAGTAQTVYKGQLFGATGELQVLSISQVNGVWTALLQVAHGSPQVVKVGATLEVS